MRVHTEYILSESELGELIYKANTYDDLKRELQKLKREYTELDSNYTKLLVFGVSLGNERLKIKV